MKEIQIERTISERVADTIDSVLAPFAPRVVMNRKMNRLALSRASAYSNAYRSASKTRSNDNWVVSSGSPDEDLLRDLPALREKSRDLNRNNAHAAGITATIVTNVVGVGIRPQCRVNAESTGMSEENVSTFQRESERSWKRWVEVADAAGVLDFYGIQNMVERQILENGEVFVIPRRIERPDSPYMLRLQIVEADRVDTPAELRGNKNVRSGIEIDDDGRPVAYYVRKSHPGDRLYRKDVGNALVNYIRYPAENALGRKNIWHLYYQKRPGQTRGEPLFSPVITAFKDLDDYMEAERVAAKVAACFSVFIKRASAGGFPLGNTSRTENGKRIETISPGIVEYLGDGEEVTFANPDRPGSNFSPFIEQMLRSISAALNMPFEVVLRDFRGSNYSSVRAALQEARRYFKERQKFLERELCQPAWEMLMEEAFLIGELPVTQFYAKREALTAVKWISPGWGWIDPTKEVEAARSAIEGHLSTLAKEAAAMGEDWEDNLEQEAKELKKKRELGLVDVPTTKRRTLFQEQEAEEPLPAPAGK